jgi:EmrB/QacA subfamily drug resistance transporter
VTSLSAGPGGGQAPAAGAAGAGPSRLGWPVWRLAWVIVFGAFTSGLDTSLANIALETIRADLHASLDQAQWVTSSYVLALAVSLPACAWLSRKAGAGRLWLAALTAFVIGSGLCAAAPSLAALIGFRVLQGLAAGLLIPAGQTILGQAVGPGRLGRVMATLGIAVSAAPALGPVAGGLMLHSLSWRWLFLINIPIGAAGLALGLRLIPRGIRSGAPSGAAATARTLDWLGFAYITTGLPLVVYALTRWGATGTPATGSVLIPFALGAAGLVLFFRRSRPASAGAAATRARRPRPLLDLGLYRNPVYAAASAAAACTGALMFGSALLYPLYFQTLHGDGTITTGLRLLSLGGGTAAALPLCGRLTDRYGGGAVSMYGSLGTAIATVAFGFLSARANPVLVQLLLAMLGMAIANAAVPAGIAAYKTVRPEQLPDATAQVNILQRLGGSLGAALYGVVLARALPAGAGHAFRSAFWWQAGTALAALGCAVWLRAALRASLTTGRGEQPDHGCCA